MCHLFQVTKKALLEDGLVGPDRSLAVNFKVEFGVELVSYPPAAQIVQFLNPRNGLDRALNGVHQLRAAVDDFGCHL